MALINCPECGNKISDMAKQCIHCGFPLNNTGMVSPSNTIVVGATERESNTCLIDGKIYDLTEIKRELLSLPNGKLVNKEDKDKLAKIQDKMCYSINGFSLFAAIILTSEIRNTGSVPEIFDADQYAVKFKEDDGRIHCPRCDSTNVVTGQRGYSIIWGLAGSNRTMNRCAKCGHKWEPRK